MSAPVAPRWLIIAGIASLLWNFMGVWSFVTNWQMSKTGYVGLPDAQRETFLERLDDVRVMGQNVGWGVGEAFDALWRRAGLEIDGS